MAKKRDTSHLVLVQVERNHLFRCLHCGVDMLMELPMSINAYVQRTKVFMNAHTRCPKPKEPT